MTPRVLLLLTPLVSLLLTGACADRPKVQLSIYHSEAQTQLVSEFFEYLPINHRRVLDDQPLQRSQSEKRTELKLALVIDQTCSECYLLERTDNQIIIHGGDELGLQYGLAHALEEAGVRFFHPFDTHLPKQLALRESTESYDTLMEPERARRGLHLHTLHPAEAYYAFWEPGEQNQINARRITDWTIKNRGNYLQWVALDDITRDPELLLRWKAHTKSILDYAHGRGLETGIGIQLFSASSLQQGFTLINFEPGEGDEQQAIRDSFALLLDGLQFENVSLSFGEFFSAETQRFLDTVNLSYQELQLASPGTEMSATIHVGKNEELLVDYMGETYQYYFLVQFADQNIVPWVHTVMFYNLFEDAGGAYHHDDFAEHRDFLFDRLQAGKRVAYHPETAYWVAFDISVPVYMPLYIRTRWLDLDLIRSEMAERGGQDLSEQILFSTGWEWGYWQNDYTALRSSYRLPARWEDQVEEMYEHWGERGARLAAAIVRLTEKQSEALIEQRLVAYLAGQDIAIEAGRLLDIVSQPDRPTFEEIAAFDEAAQTTFRSDVLDPLESLAVVSEGVVLVMRDLDLPRRWIEELLDAAIMSALRTRFAHAVFTAALETGEGKPVVDWLTRADAILVEAEEVVARRARDFHHPEAARLTKKDNNATVYQFGYLRQAHDLCYWKRERVQLDRLLGLSDKPAPTCLFN